MSETITALMNELKLVKQEISSLLSWRGLPGLQEKLDRAVQEKNHILLKLRSAGVDIAGL